MCILHFDPKLTFDGVLTSIALFGALISYIANSRSQNTSKRKHKKEHADKLTIMVILETNLIDGLTENQIIEEFNSERTKDFRVNVSSTEPSKLKKVDYNIYIRDLQLSSIIEQVDVSKFKLKVYPVTKSSK